MDWKTHPDAVGKCVTCSSWHGRRPDGVDWLNPVARDVDGECDSGTFRYDHFAGDHCHAYERGYKDGTYCRTSRSE